MTTYRDAVEEYAFHRSLEPLPRGERPVCGGMALQQGRPRGTQAGQLFRGLENLRTDHGRDPLHVTYPSMFA